MTDRTGDGAVIVGGGLGGLRTAEELRRRDYAGAITIIGREVHRPYDRPPLSKRVLHAEADDPWLRTDDELHALEVTLRAGVSAVGVDVDGHRIHTDRDGEIGYDVLVIATGAVPRRVPGLDGMVLRTLDDARSLRTVLARGERIVVVGAGLIGCEVAASARAMGVEVVLVDILTGPMIRVVGEQVSRHVADLHASRGVHLHLGTSVQPAGPGAVTLGDGTQLHGDAVVEAIGAAPDTAWLSGSGLPIGDGIACDGDGRAAPGVFAVGDVANWGGRRHEHWTSVGVQADHVAAMITGSEPHPAAVDYWWSDQYDLKIQGLGSPGPDDDVRIGEWGKNRRTLAVYSSGGTITGGVGFSAAGGVLGLRADITAGRDINEVYARLGW